MTMTSTGNEHLDSVFVLHRGITALRAIRKLVDAADGRPMLAWVTDGRLYLQAGVDTDSGGMAGGVHRWWWEIRRVSGARDVAPFRLDPGELRGLTSKLPRKDGDVELFVEQDDGGPVLAVRLAPGLLARIVRRLPPDPRDKQGRREAVYEELFGAAERSGDAGLFHCDAGWFAQHLGLLASLRPRETTKVAMHGGGLEPVRVVSERVTRNDPPQPCGGQIILMPMR